MAAEQLAVLVMAYGGPGNIDEVEPYLLDVRGGRPTKPQLVEEIRKRYARIGGRPPALRFTAPAGAGGGGGAGGRVRVSVGRWDRRPHHPEERRPGGRGG